MRTVTNNPAARHTNIRFQFMVTNPPLARVRTGFHYNVTLFALSRVVKLNCRSRGRIVSLESVSRRQFKYARRYNLARTVVRCTGLRDVSQNSIDNQRIEQVEGRFKRMVFTQSELLGNPVVP